MSLPEKDLSSLKLEGDIEVKNVDRDREEEGHQPKELFRSFPWAQKLLSWGIEARGQSSLRLPSNNFDLHC